MGEISMELLRSDKAIVGQRQHRTDSGVGEIQYVILADGFMIDCGHDFRSVQRAAEVTRRRLVQSARSTDPIETEAGIDTLCRAIRHGQRFVLSPLFVETAAQLAEPRAVDRSRDALFTPADITWLEWEGDAPGGNPRSRAISM